MSAKQSDDTLRYALALLESNDGVDAAEAALRESKRRESSSPDEPARRLIYGQTPSSLADQLNRWVGSQKTPDDWKPDPLAADLPEPLRELPAVQNLGDKRFANTDGAVLREQRWLHEISRWICGDASDDLERGRRLFDWTIRNLQLDASPDSDDEQARPPYLPWHLLALGHGRAEDRAWLFMLLARQQALDVVLLEPASEKPTTLLGLLHDDQLYLFDAQLGVAVPGPQQDGAQEAGIATLAQAAEDDSLLRRLDLDAEHPYPLTSSDLSKVAAAIEASPVYFQRRMALLDARLVGDEKLVLSFDASALAARLKDCPHVEKAELWQLPFERLQGLAQRKSPGVKRLVSEMQVLMAEYPHVVKKKQEMAMALWRGRVEHLLGRFTGESSANYFYQFTRISDADIGRMATAFGPARPGEAPEIAQQRRSLEGLANAYRAAKRDASYWLGLVAFERGDYVTAVDYFKKRSLEAAPDGPWTAGARYNLGRAYEALGRRAEAIAAYRSDDSAQRHGSELRARWLEQAPADAK
ncbi:MAG TPA: tetratricopeptide repeat protein [Pirellulales bacterium]|nr:tetratricopeptide repeat protein [Pirellulales bacterium]